MKNQLLLIFCFCFYYPLCFGQNEILEIEGAIQIGNSIDPTPDAGTIRWYGSDFEGWNGTEWLSLTENVRTSTVTDIDGNIYGTITINNQEWMTENLKVSKLNNGTAISLVSSDASWSNLTTPAYCWYNNNPVNDATVGKMYNWYTTDTGNLCPAGWHVPTLQDYTDLINFLGGNTVAGGKLLSNGTNESGWSGDFGGRRFETGLFQFFGGNGTYWMQTQSSSTFAWIMYLFNGGSNADFYTNNKKTGASVRCVR